MRGCRALTRPSIISGKPGTSDIPMTGSPASASALAVPPVDTSSHFLSDRTRANGTRPVLSETLSNARMDKRVHFGAMLEEGRASPLRRALLFAPFLLFLAIYLPTAGHGFIR